MTIERNLIYNFFNLSPIKVWFSLLDLNHSTIGQIFFLKNEKICTKLIYMILKKGVSKTTKMCEAYNERYHMEGRRST